MATPVALPTMTNSGLATVMMELDKITKVLEVVVTYVPMVAPFFPPLAPVVPFLPVIQAALKILDDVEAAGGDPMVVLKSIEAGVPDLMAKFKAAQVHPTVVAATAAAQAAPA